MNLSLDENWVDLYLSRWYLPDCTLGILSGEGFQSFTLELPWLDNANDISCIPGGNYEYFFRHSPHNGPVLELRDVSFRTNIQVHAGNFTSDILGCILVGDSIRFLNSDSTPDVANSKNTLKKLLQISDTKGTLHIS